MPGRDGTGPLGAGAATGRGLGPCGTTAAGVGTGLGLGLGLGRRGGRGMRCGRGTGFSQTYTAGTSKELLTQQRDVLKQRMDALDRQLSDK